MNNLIEESKNCLYNACLQEIFQIYTYFGEMSKKICTSFVCRLLIKNMPKMIVDKTNWCVKNVKVFETESK